MNISIRRAYIESLCVDITTSIYTQISKMCIKCANWLIYTHSYATESHSKQQCVVDRIKSILISVTYNQYQSIYTMNAQFDKYT